MKEKSNIPSEYTFGIKLLIVLYALTPFVPRLEAIDPIGSQWLYFGVLNMVSLLLVYFLNKKVEIRQVLGKHILIYVFLAFILVACLSLFTAINMYEGLRVLARVLTSFIGVVSLYFLFQIDANAFFRWLAKVLIVVTFLISLQVVFHFVSNWNTPRLNDLVEGARLLFGTRNATSATLVTLLPFSMWGLLFLNRKWFYLSLFTCFLCVTAILYVGSRTALISGGLILLLFILFYILSKSSEPLSRKLKNNLLPLLAMVILGFILVLNSNKLYNKKGNTFYDIIHTSANYEDLKNAKLTNKSIQTNVRILFYEMALEDIKSKPLLGLGLGNWKLSNKDSYYKKSAKDKYIYPVRTHNDFLQVTAETGVLGGILYLLLFVVIGFMLIRGFIKAIEKENKWTYLILLFAFIAYSIDAMLNFPLERTPLQVLWVFITAFVLALSSEIRDVKSISNPKVNTLKAIVLVIVNTGILFVLYFNYKSFVAESYILADTSNKDLLTSKYVYKYDQARGMLSSIFNITGGGKPVDHYLAMYAMSEGNDNLALNHLDKSIKIAPNHYESKGLKAIIYGQRKKNLDSAIYYAKEGFQKYPAIKNNYVILLNAYREQKDTTAYFNTYDAWLEKFPDDVSQWQAKAERLFEFYKDEERVIKTIDKAISLNPGSQDLVKFREKYVSKSRSEDIRKWYKNAFVFIKENNNTKAKEEFLKILEVSPTNGATLLNLGIIELKMKQYKEAIGHLTTIIEAKSFKDGRPEYNRARAYEELGEIEKAKKDYRRSKKLGYKLAQKLPKSKLE